VKKVVASARSKRLSWTKDGLMNLLVNAEKELEEAQRNLKGDLTTTLHVLPLCIKYVERDSREGITVTTLQLLRMIADRDNDAVPYGKHNCFVGLLSELRSANEESHKLARKLQRRSATATDFKNLLRLVKEMQRALVKYYNL